MNSSTFFNLELGKRGVLAHQRAFATVGHNLANLETEGYSRQRVQLQATAPLYAPDLSRNGRLGQIGTGVEVTLIERIRDQLLDDQILANNDSLSFWQTRKSYTGELAQIFQEPDNSSTRQVMDQFWQAWQDLSATPSNIAAREQLLQRGISLAEHINIRYRRLDGLQAKLDQQLVLQVQEVNQLLDNIAATNGMIQRSLAIGDQPNDLFDRRDLLVEKLSNYLDVSVERDRDPDEFLVHIDGRHLVQGLVASPFIIQKLASNRSELLWQGKGVEQVELNNGSLAALEQLRDGDVAGEIAALDQLSISYIDLVNQVHSEAVGLDGGTNRPFFDYYRQGDAATGNYDASGDGIADSTLVYRINGSKALDISRTLGIAGQLSLLNSDGEALLIDYQANDTVSEVIDRLNRSNAQVFARLNHNQQLELRSRASDVQLRIDSLADSGLLLSSYAGLLNPGQTFDSNQVDSLAALAEGAGWQGSPQQHPAASMRVNLDLQQDVSRIAASLPEKGQNVNRVALGDNRAALAIAALAHQAVMPGDHSTLSDFYANRIARVGEQQQQAMVFHQTFTTDLKQLRDLRQSISGVSLDEEFASMIRFQRGYEASARFLSAANDLLDILLNRMGVA